MMIQYAELTDIVSILRLDRHIKAEILKQKIAHKEVYVIKESDKVIGTLRYSLFWDNTPFMNMLYIEEEYQKKGYGTLIVDRWEQDMKNSGYEIVMTSTQSNEEAQHFYRKRGYKDAGGFIYPGDPFELIFIKDLK